MNYHILPPCKPVGGTVHLPASKSISNRALIMSTLAGDTSGLRNLADCDDTRVMITALGNNSTHIDIGAAGTAMRFLTAYLATCKGTWHITGSSRMQQRPIGVLVEALNQLGACIRYTGRSGYPPLQITGDTLQGGKINLAGNISSQYISALLMIAPVMRDGLTVELEGSVISQPYIRMTLEMMKTFGVRSAWTDNVITVAKHDYKAIPYLIESDWSAASYWYAITALSEGSSIELPGLLPDSTQGDARVADIFAGLGVDTVYSAEGVTLTHSGKKPDSFEYDFINEPDLAQTVVVTCCLLGIPFSFSGLQSLRIKETDRIAALIAESAKLGYRIEETAPAVLAWDGSRTSPVGQAVITTYEDHRMAMAFAPAAFMHDLRIEHPGVVSKSYPGFWNDLRGVGFVIG
jgi:3-phosphoshikimate 1-carboxyvinyltransferase